MKTGVKVLLVIVSVFGFVGLLGSSASASGVLTINEFSANPGAGDTDWVELHNAGPSEMSLDGWYLRDTASSNLKTFGTDDVVPAGGFYVAQVGNRLGNSGDTIELYSPSGLEDSIVYPDSVDVPAEGQSAGRSVDGAGAWVVFAVPTKGMSNGGVVPSYGEIRVHAVEEINDNTTPDFNAGEPHQAGKTMRVYDATWNLIDSGVTTGLAFQNSLRFTVEVGNYFICQVAETGFEQSFARSIAGWYNFPDTSASNLSSAEDEHGRCVNATVAAGEISSHVFGERAIGAPY